MTEFKLIDDRVEPDEDSYETTPKQVSHFEEIYGLKFGLDAAATVENKKTENFLTDAMHQEWNVNILGTPYYHDVWCNPPHSMNLDFVKRADAQHKKYNINICMLIPTRIQSSPVFHELIENETEVFVENHPVLRRPKFLKNGRPTKHGSKNGYCVIIWRKK